MSKIITVLVASDSIEGQIYTVRKNTETNHCFCNCLGFTNHLKCKHVSRTFTESNLTTVENIMSLVDTHITFGNKVIKNKEQIIEIIKEIKFSGEYLKILNIFRHYIVNTLVKRYATKDFNAMSRV